MDLEAQTHAALQRLANLAPRLNLGRVVVAVSGGADSVALLHICAVLGLDVVVAHLDHALRPTSRQDASFVTTLATKLGLPSAQERVDVAHVAQNRSWSLEDAARRVRYEFLSRVAKTHNANAILTAHTQNDQAETVLLQLLRGTAKATGIPERNGRVLRPVLNVSKLELQRFLQDRNHVWREDETNQDTRFTRNWLRHVVMPLVLARFPNAHQQLARFAALQHDDHAVLQDLTRRVSVWANWQHEPVALQRRLIAAALHKANIPSDHDHLEALREALGRTTTTRISLPKNATGLVRSGQIKVLHPKQAAHFEITAHDQALVLAHAPQAQQRTRNPGDRIRLAGGTRKLSDVFIDAHIPKEHRDHIPLLADGTNVLLIGTSPPIFDVRVQANTDQDVLAMQAALRLAQQARDAGEVPVGAVVLQHNQITGGIVGSIVGQGHNQSQALHDMTQHAEITALRQAAQHLGRAHLHDCTLVVTLEPCLMCLGATLEARVSRIVFGAPNPKSGALGGVLDATRADWSHRVDVRPGVLGRECAALLSDFFEGLRQPQTQNP